ncbi:ABC transporter permease subunit [[Mycoplasma] cavipharyngis]|uniref:phosphate ABC transporter permease n=1 Tax=[Mycoplasma] cavipharyngis TaxID=92757 RepID=UPI003703A7F8
MSTAFFILIFVFLFVFLIKESVLGFQTYGLKRIFLSSDFNFQNANSGVSFWLPLSVTLLITLLALLISTPIGIKTAILIQFRIKNLKLKKYLRLFIAILAGIPSVVFGLFARNYLGGFLQTVFNLPTSFNLITGSFMLAFMILPTIIFLTIEALASVDLDLLLNSISLGVSKTKGIYQVVLKKIRPLIVVALFIAAGRAIGETMAVSMILQSEAYDLTIDSGFYSFLTSSLTPIGAVISTNMFSDGSGPEARSVLFGFGIALLIIVVLLNGIITVLVKENNNQNNRWFKKWPGWLNYQKRVKLVSKNLLSQLFWKWELLTYSPAKKIASEKNLVLSQYIAARKSRNDFRSITNAWKFVSEILAGLVVLSFIFWILIVILTNGFAVWFSNQNSLFTAAKNSTLYAFLTTILVIAVAIIIALPLSLLIAIYLNEYCKKRLIKKTTYFVLQVLQSTPSILFALFGLSFFILNLGLTASGVQGRSILAGSLTIAIVILPHLILLIKFQLELVPQALRDNSYALGVNKATTIIKIVLPKAFSGIVESVISIIGRIMGETAPLYLTAGLSSGRLFALNQPGQTITTRIYAQIYNNNLVEANQIMFENALLSIIIIDLIILFVNIFLPWIMQNTKYTWQYFVWSKWQKMQLIKTKSILNYWKLSAQLINRPEKLALINYKITKYQNQQTQLYLELSK